MFLHEGNFVTNCQIILDNLLVFFISNENWKELSFRQRLVEYFILYNLCEENYDKN